MIFIIKKAFITGITGQDGSYLAELLLNKGYEVHGMIRRSSTFNTARIDHLYQDPHEDDINLKLHYGNMVDSSNISRLIEKIEPDEVYNLAAQSNVSVSFKQPEYTTNVDALGTLRLLDAIKDYDEIKFLQASTSELFGNVEEVPQDEDTSFNPQSPYAVAKLYAYWITKNYRNSYDLFGSNCIGFNHESERRGKRFVTRKITRAVAKINAGLQDKLYLGNLDSKRDWGYAPECVEAMWKMLQHDEPDDFVVATNEVHSVRDFAEKAFSVLDYNIVWQDSGINEKGIDKKTGKVLIEVDKKYFRPSEVNLLKGDYSKIEGKLDWKPETDFGNLVRKMVEHDVEMLKEKGEIGLDYLG